MTDLHLHTCFSFDSEEKAENYISAAKSKGFKSIGFSEHYDYDVFFDGGDYLLPDLSAYSRKIAELQRQYPEIRILKGIELGYRAEAVPHYNELLKNGNFDYAILSVHTLKGRGDCYYPDFYKGLTRKQAYEAYFKAVLESVRSELNYQIIGHVGYIERYAPYDDKRIIYGEYAAILDEILKEIIARDKCLEINTSAEGTGEFTIPNREIIERYIALGGKNFTLGSDAHSAQRFAENFSAVKDYLLTCGVNSVCRYEHGALIKEKFQN